MKLLHDAGITAVHIGTGSSLYEAVSLGEYRFGWYMFVRVHCYYNGIGDLVFMSPEVAVGSPWRKIFQTSYLKKHLALIAVDKAHCIPEWCGHKLS